MEISGESVKKCKKIAKKCKNYCVYEKKAVSLQRISIVEYITIKITQELWKRNVFLSAGHKANGGTFTR